MSVKQIKIKIFLMRSFDMLLLLCVFAMGVWGIFYSDMKEIMMLLTLIGLFIVNKIGTFTANKVALLRYQIKKIEKPDKI